MSPKFNEKHFPDFSRIQTSNHDASQENWTKDFKTNQGSNKQENILKSMVRDESLDRSKPEEEDPSQENEASVLYYDEEDDSYYDSYMKKTDQKEEKELSVVTEMDTGGSVSVSHVPMKSMAARKASLIQGPKYRVTGVITKENKPIRYHREKYKEAKELIDKQRLNIEEILEIKQELSSRRIMAIKMNSSLEEIV